MAEHDDVSGDHESVTVELPPTSPESGGAQDAAGALVPGALFAAAATILLARRRRRSHAER